MGHSDEWDKEIERDFRNGGPLSPVLKRVRHSSGWPIDATGFGR
jgi:hypothetical protein